MISDCEIALYIALGTTSEAVRPAPDVELYRALRSRALSLHLYLHLYHRQRTHLLYTLPQNSGRSSEGAHGPKKKENRQPKRGMGEEDRQGPHLHEQDFGRTIRGTGGARLLLLTRDTTGSRRGARGLPTPLAVSSQSSDLPPASHWQSLLPQAH